MSEPEACRRLREFADNLVADGSIIEGVQLSIAVPGRRFDIVAGRGGTGAALTSAKRFRLYCAGKPLVALAALRALHERRIPLGVAVGDAMRHSAWRLPAYAGEYTLGDLLSHRTCLIRPRGVEVGVETRPGAMRVAADRAPAVRGAAGYSEVTTWMLLSDAVEQMTGRPFATEVRRTLDDLDLRNTTFGMSTAEAAAVAGDTEVNVRRVGAQRVPMLWNRSVSSLTTFEPAFGGYGTANDLATFWRAVGCRSRYGGKVRPDALTEACRSMVHERREMILDAALGYECSFGMGAMVDLRQHWEGTSLSRRSVGHSGFMGVSFGLAQPEAQFALGCNVVGISDGENTAEFLRPTLINMALRVLG